MIPAGTWQANEWRWDPSAGRWSMAYGMPATPIAFTLASDDAAVPDPYDHWRHIAYYSFEADSLPIEQARRFRAQARCIAADAAQLYMYRSNAVAGSGVPADKSDDRESYCIGLVIEGERAYEQRGAARIVNRAGEFFVWDNRWSSRIDWTDHYALHLQIPRVAVERLLGPDIPEPAVMLKALERSRLAVMLKQQLRASADHMARVDGSERAFLLDQLVRMALFTLDGAASDMPDRGARDVIRAAALRVIEQRLDEPALDVSAIVGAVGCSRATLYRAFAEAGTSVRDAIEEARLVLAERLLAEPRDMPISFLAARCGWYDASAFARAFKRRTGLTPSDYRTLRRAN